MPRHLNCGLGAVLFVLLAIAPRVHAAVVTPVYGLAGSAVLAQFFLPPSQPIAGRGKGGNGLFEVYDDAWGGFRHLDWGFLPWSAYNSMDGSTRVATGDVDGDGLDEVIIGLASVPGVTNSWIAVLDNEWFGFSLLRWIQVPFGSAYNSANGETWVAACDLFGDGFAEIVVGQGTYTADGGRWFVFDDARSDFALLHSDRLPWSVYNSADGQMRPATGDLDGDGRAEVLFGLGPHPANGGWYAVYDDARSGFAFRTWLRLPWSAYNSAVGATRLAAADLYGDGGAEIIVGTDSFPSNGGWFEVVDNAYFGFNHLAWVQVPYASYNSANGETRPATGDLFGDRSSEIVIGLGPFAGNTSNLALFSDGNGGFAFNQFLSIHDSSYDASNGEAWPATGVLR